MQYRARRSDLLCSHRKKRSSFVSSTISLSSLMYPVCDPARNIHHFLRWLHKKRIFSRIYLYTLYATRVLIQRKWILETDILLRIDERPRNSPSHARIRSVQWISLFTGAVIFPVGARFFPRGEESKQFSGSHDGNMIPATSRKNDLASFRWIMQYPFRLIYGQGQREVRLGEVKPTEKRRQ